MLVQWWACRSWITIDSTPLTRSPITLNPVAPWQRPPARNAIEREIGSKKSHVPQLTAILKKASSVLDIYLSIPTPTPGLVGFSMSSIINPSAISSTLLRKRLGSVFSCRHNLPLQVGLSDSRNVCIPTIPPLLPVCSRPRKNKELFRFQMWKAVKLHLMLPFCNAEAQLICTPTKQRRVYL